MAEATGVHWPRTLAPAAVLAFALTGLAGLWLAGPYDPEDAHGSVQRMDGVTAWVRSLHWWLATATLVLGGLALMDAWTRRPDWTVRLPTWYSAVAGVALAAGAILVGGILPGDQHAAESRQHVGMVTAPFGIEADRFSDGSYFLLHSWGIAIAAALAALVFLRTYSTAVATRLLYAWPLSAGALGACAILATASSPPHGPRPIDGLFVGKPDWPFLWLVPFQDQLGGRVGLLTGLIAMTGLAVASPWIGTGWSRRRRAWLAAAAVGGFLLLSIGGTRS